MGGSGGVYKLSWLFAFTSVPVTGQGEAAATVQSHEVILLFAQQTGIDPLVLFTFSGLFSLYPNPTPLFPPPRLTTKQNSFPNYPAGSENKTQFFLNY